MLTVYLSDHCALEETERNNSNLFLGKDLGIL